MFQKYLIDFSNQMDCGISIVDSDFESEVYWIKPFEAVTTVTTNLIIKIYSEKQFDVAKNLFLYMKFLEENRNWDISEQIKYFHSQNDKCHLHLYIPEIQKYLLFI